MCGRFALEDDGTAVQAQFNLSETPQLAPRYNIAPTQPVAAVIMAENGQRMLDHFHWGLIPFWAKDTKMASRMINARSETAHEKPAFRAAFKRRRCLIPMSGFYEWQKLSSGKKQPVYIHPVEGPLLAAAGLWESWSSDEGGEIPSLTILTSEPNERMTPIHNRMPVFIDLDDYDAWLDQKTPLPIVHELLKPYRDENIAMYEVSTVVNNARNETAECIAPLPRLL